MLTKWKLYFFFKIRFSDARFLIDIGYVLVFAPRGIPRRWLFTDIRLLKSKKCDSTWKDIFSRLISLIPHIFRRLFHLNFICYITKRIFRLVYHEEMKVTIIICLKDDWKNNVYWHPFVFFFIYYLLCFICKYQFSMMVIVRGIGTLNSGCTRVWSHSSTRNFCLVWKFLK